MLLLPGKEREIKKAKWSNATRPPNTAPPIQDKLLVYQPSLNEVFEPLFSSFYVNVGISSPKLIIKIYI
jgi:hypothetical protein